MKRLLAVMLATAGFAVAGPAQAQDRVELGTLDCVVKGGTGFIVGSTKDLSCTFLLRRSNRGRRRNISVSSRSSGWISAGLTGSVIKWLVLAPTMDAYAPGKLAGEYVGVSPPRRR